ncbi:MAG: NTP transferase domain-containing protein [Pirellulaceae bacterium]|jgi:molybdopterin-guanine dinucleotide biosynthesis protein A|nr:NTP transferase domain-containing protein [Pirellulaceae bacterium]
MGRAKATLPFGAELLLPRVVRLLAEAVAPCVVVAAPEQDVPALPAEVRVVRDRQSGRGPLEGLYCGLAALGTAADAAYVTGCDVPLLQPAFVRRMIDLLGDGDVVVPVEGAFHFPLAAVYRTRVVEPIALMLQRGELRMISFYERVATRTVPVDSLREVDPDLRSLLNVNKREDYARALRLANLPLDE